MRGCNPGTPFSHLPLHSCLAWRGAGEAFAAEHARGFAHERRRRALQVWRIDGAHLGKHGEQVSKTLYGVSKTLAGTPRPLRPRHAHVRGGGRDARLRDLVSPMAF